MTFTVACAGAGYFSRFHYESWARIPESSVVAACDIDVTKARATGLPAFDDLGAMLIEVSPDVLDIILPPNAHADAIRLALRNGVKWIICQKPFCNSLDEAAKVVGEAKAIGAKIVVHENFRFQPWFRAIKTEIEKGSIGKVVHATFRFRPGDGQGADVYLDRQPYFRDMPHFLIHETGVHYVDVFRFLFGDPIGVYADLRRINSVIKGEDAGVVLFDHPEGVRAIFDGNRNLDHAADNLRRTMGEALVEGTAGTLRLIGDGSVMLRRFGEREEFEVLPPDRHDGFGGDCVHCLQSHIASGILHGTALENEAFDYLTVLKTEAAIYASAKSCAKSHLSEP